MQTLQVLNENQFIGMNDRWPSHLLPPGVFQLVDNVFIDNNALIKRGGNDPVAATLGAFTILGGSSFEPNGGTKQIVVCRDGSSNAQLYNWTGSGTFSAIGSANLTAGAQMNFVQASNYLFGFNGTDVVDYDGTTVTKNRASVPLGKFGFWFHNYLFVAGVSGNPNRLYWSNLGTPTTFSGTDYIDINANDGDMITGISILNDELLVFKQYSIWSITGWSGSSFTSTTIAGQNTNARIFGFGTVSHQSIISVGREVYFLSFIGGVPHIKAVTQTVFGKVIDAGVISYDIEGTMNGLNKSQLSKAAGVYDGRRCYWALPNGSSTTNNLVIVLRPDLTTKSPLGTVRSWARFSGMTPGQFLVSTVSGRQKIYFTDATTGGLVYEFNTSSYTDNGTAVTMTVKSRDYAFSEQKRTKFKYSYVKHKTGSAGTLSWYARVDQAASFALQRSISLAGNSPGLGPTGTFTLGISVLGGSNVTERRITYAHMVGYLLGIEFVESTANSCEIYAYSILGKTKGMRDA